MNEQQWGLGFDVLGKGTLGERMRRLNRLQVPNLGFSSHRPDSLSLFGRLVESVTYSSTRIPLGLAEFLLGLAESSLKIRVSFPFLAFLTLGVTLLLSCNFLCSISVGVIFYPRLVVQKKVINLPSTLIVGSRPRTHTT